MLRFLVLALVLLLAWRATMLLLERARLGAERQMRGGGRRATAGEELVRCVACGTRVPASRALAGDAGLVCSETCRGRAAGGAA
jgi:hypothetical protein